MASNNTLEHFLGGSPLSTFVRLFVISLVVGALLMWLELRPIDIFRGVQAFFDRIYQLGFGAVRELVSLCSPARFSSSRRGLFCGW